jgi:DNA excision repair protein ERCC-2
MSPAGRRIYFPFEKLRPQQDAMMHDILSAVEGQKHILCHAPTGLGKTAAALAPALSVAMEEGLTVFFLTPKISQHEIALQCARKMRERYSLDFRAIDFVGKRFLCIDPFISNMESSSFYELCKRRRAQEACMYYGNAVGYSTAARQLATEHMLVLRNHFAKKGTLDHIALMELCSEFEFHGEKRPLCVYEAACMLAKHATLIVADYFHIFNPKIQRVVLAKTKKKLKRSIIVVDEAHNLPGRVRAMLSQSLSTLVLEKAADEMLKIGNTSLAATLKEMRSGIKILAKCKLAENVNETLVAKQEFSELIERYGEPDILMEELRNDALEFLEAGFKHHSFALSVANFIEAWHKEHPGTIRMVRKQKRGYAVQLRALDPSVATHPIFEKLYASILMSGTLLPLQMYADLLGLEESRVVLRHYSSPFPRENMLNLIVPTSTTLYAERTAEQFDEISKLVAKVACAVPGNVAVFFPSFDVLREVLMRVQQNKLLGSRPIFAQQERMNATQRHALLQRFRDAASSHAVLFAVAGGMFSEGIDYFGEQLLGAIIVGVPLQEMNLETKCLIEYYEEKFGRGWHYGYIFPAVNKALQAAGRVIRSEKDRGVAVFIDKRYLWKNYAGCLPQENNFLVVDNPARYVRDFFKSQGSNEG